MAKPIGRPSSFTPEIGEEICFRMEEGESLRQICRDKGMPSKAAVSRWLLKEDTEFVSFRDHYIRARRVLLEHWADEIIEISDDGSNDWMVRETERGNVVESVNHEHVNRSRLRVDSRKWLLSKLDPKKYGDQRLADGDDADGKERIIIEGGLPDVTAPK